MMASGEVNLVRIEHEHGRLYSLLDVAGIGRVRDQTVLATDHTPGLQYRIRLVRAMPALGKDNGPSQLRTCLLSVGDVSTRRPDPQAPTVRSSRSGPARNSPSSGIRQSLTALN